MKITRHINGKNISSEHLNALEIDNELILQTIANVNNRIKTKNKYEK